MHVCPFFWLYYFTIFLTYVTQFSFRTVFSFAFAATLLKKNMKQVITQLRVLVVEDDHICAQVTKILLGNEFEVDIVDTGYKAIEAASTNYYDIILMDINLGDVNMDGLKTMRRIRANKKSGGVKIIAATVFTHSRGWFINQGFDDLIKKPVTLDSVLDSILNEQMNYRYN
jgi:CheY-like chemotaxis protein